MRNADMYDRVLENGLRVVGVRHGHVPLTEVHLVVPWLSRGPRRLYDALLYATCTARHTGGAGSGRAALDHAAADTQGTASPWNVLFSGHCHTDDLSLLLRFLACAVDGPPVSEVDAAQERERLWTRLRVADSYSQTRVLDALYKRLYREHPAGTRVLTAQDIPEAEDVLQGGLSDIVLDPRGATLVIASGVDPRAVVDAAAVCFGTWQAVDQQARGIPEAPPVASADPVVFPIEAAQRSHIRLRAQGVSYTDPRYPALLVALNALGGFSSSRLMRRLRGDRGYVYGVSAFVDAFPGGSLVAIEADTASDRTADVLADISAELSRMCSCPLSGDEFLAARRQSAGALATRLTSQAELASAMADMALNGADPATLPQFGEQLGRVTHDEMVDVCRELLTPDRFTGVIGGDPSILGKTALLNV